MKVLTVVGARPQFVKAAPVSAALRQAGCDEFMVHTGQHYDHLLSQVFFDELGMATPQVNLGVGSGSHGRQTGQMLMALEEVMQAQEPEWVLTYGDTNSTLAAALAASKLRLPLAHVEAGLRSFNREMPEE
ncbi:MAG: UDP-N-acetylglucosamine 2-epimerase, partial [Candidatus Latescibacterota bacterium]